MAEATSIRSVMLQELGADADRTRRVLERVPADRWDWRPHEKSTPMGRLAGHVATLPSFVRVILTTERFDMMNPPAGYVRTQWPETAAQLVPTAERVCAEAREALEEARDEDLFVPWSFTVGDQRIVTGVPRYVAMRRLAFDHLIHHRAQLGVYFRLCDVPVPALFGPSADEPWRE